MKKTAAASAILVVIALAGLGAWVVYRSGQQPTEIVGSVNLGFVNGESASALYIADALGFFSDHGLQVTLQPFVVGLDSYNAMLKGQVDISGPTEYVIVGGAFRRDKIRALSTIVQADLFSIIGRKDRGIEKVSDLAGKRIGVPRKTLGEFYLGRFLDLHGMSMNDATLVDQSPADSVGAIEQGAIDGVVTLPPFADSIRSGLGAGCVEWPAQSSQRLYGILTSTDDWIARNPDGVVRLLKAVDQANTYIIQHPKEAQAIVQKRLNLGAESVDVVWQRNTYSLSLDQSLIAAMEDEARWMIQNNLTMEKTTPNFADYIYMDGLKAVKPDAVNIIR